MTNLITNLDREKKWVSRVKKWAFELKLTPKTLFKWGFGGQMPIFSLKNYWFFYWTTNLIREKKRVLRIKKWVIDPQNPIQMRFWGSNAHFLGWHVDLFFTDLTTNLVREKKRVSRMKKIGNWPQTLSSNEVLRVKCSFFCLKCWSINQRKWQIQ